MIFFEGGSGLGLGSQSLQVGGGNNPVGGALCFWEGCQVLIQALMNFAGLCLLEFSSFSITFI